MNYFKTYTTLIFALKLIFITLALTKIYLNEQKNISFVSSFSPNGFVEYGKKFIESFDSDDINLFIGVEDDPSNYPKKKNIFYFSKFINTFNT